MRQRVLSSLVGIPLLIAIFYFGTTALQFAWLTIIAIILGELHHMVFGKLEMINYGLALAFLSAITYDPTYFASALSIYLISALIINVIIKQGYPLTKVVLAITGVIYIATSGFLFNALLVKGFSVIIGCLILAWSYDTCAYLSGRKWGKRRPWPILSPKKSIEGVIGGAIGSIVISSAYGIYAGFSVVSIIVFAIGGVFLAQCGDLIESAYKRECGVKDAGKIMPGHGGLWDRFDSVLPVLAWANFVFIFLGL